MLSGLIPYTSSPSFHIFKTFTSVFSGSVGTSGSLFGVYMLVIVMTPFSISPWFDIYSLGTFTSKILYSINFPSSYFGSSSQVYFQLFFALSFAVLYSLPL